MVGCSLPEAGADGCDTAVCSKAGQHGERTDADWAGGGRGTHIITIQSTTYESASLFDDGTNDAMAAIVSLVWV